MQYPNSDVLDVLHLYEGLTGKKLVMDNNVQGKVNIFIAKPIPRDEARSRSEPGDAPLIALAEATPAFQGPVELAQPGATYDV